jgi:hypothetical protein
MYLNMLKKPIIRESEKENQDARIKIQETRDKNQKLGKQYIYIFQS